MPSHQPAGRVHQLDPTDRSTRAEIEQLFDRVTRTSGQPALSEASQLSWDGNGGYMGIVHRSDTTIDGYGQLGNEAGSVHIELVVDPQAASPSQLRTSLLASALRLARDGRTEQVRYWDLRHQHDDEAVQDLGFSLERELLQMRVALPLATKQPRGNPDLVLRAFRPGQDEARWLEVNNRAFATHPEQGHWDMDTLLAREQAPWFDPDGFLMGEISDQLAASCWTKIHAEQHPALGEIYVISVDPLFQGRGLGRLLAVAGLEWLAQHVSVGMLYVEASNDPALSLYQSLGFQVHHRDRCYLWERDASTRRV